ncbi:MAG: sulfotransferase [Pseudomonadota bacterium]
MKLPEQFSTVAELLHDEAVAATGLDDFGKQDYLEALQVLLTAYDETARFGELGRFASVASLVNCLKGRLYTQHGITQNPDCVNQRIEQPVFIVGLPRTGTTILHRLLAQHRANQGLEYFIGSYPMPRPPREQWRELEGYKAVDSSLEMLGQINPELKAIHEMTTEGVDECRLLLMQSFANVTFQSNASVPGYEQWLYQADFEGVYRDYYQALQLIGSTAPGKRWILKDPSHMWAMDTLLGCFPDAIIVQTHRDPVELIPSVSSLVMSAKNMNEPDADEQSVGAQQLEQWATVLEKTMAVRDRHPDSFMDIYFQDFMVDPMAQLDSIYKKLNEPLQGHDRKVMAKWLASNPQGKHGAHHYTAEDFGLSKERIRERFSVYCRRFGR